MIALPVKSDCQTDAYFIRDATGRIIADNLRKEDAEEIKHALNMCEAGTHNKLPAKQVETEHGK